MNVAASLSMKQTKEKLGMLKNDDPRQNEYLRNNYPQWIRFQCGSRGGVWFFENRFKIIACDISSTDIQATSASRGGPNEYDTYQVLMKKSRDPEIRGIPFYKITKVLMYKQIDDGFEWVTGLRGC